jgi:hypothetical protein
VAHYGPTDRYYQGNYKDFRSRTLYGALLSLWMKRLKAQTKLLESLKSEIKDWDVIDTKIDF